MTKRTKVWVVTAACLIFVGAVMFVSSLAFCGWDFTKLGSIKYETNTYIVDEEFGNISVNSGTADIVFAPSEDGVCRVVCYEDIKKNHMVSVKAGTLTVNEVDQRKWYEYIGISIEFPKITVYLPQREYGELIINESTGDIKIPKDFTFESMDISTSTGDVRNYACVSGKMKIETSTADIYIEDISAKEMELSVSTGDIFVNSVKCEEAIKMDVSTGDVKLSNIECGSIVSEGSTGDITFKNVIAENKISVKRSTGDVKFNGCDAAELFVKSSTGDITGSLLSDKIFITETSTGDISVPKTVSGGRCEFKTSTGDIIITIQQ